MAATTEQIRFMTNNFITDLEDSDVTTLSTKTGYDKANVKNALRTKLWKSGGAFVVTASNNLIYLNDGSDKTATLTEGTYTYSTLATHVAEQLNAVSADWLCSYDFAGGTFKFTISCGSSATLRYSVTTTAAWDMLGFTGESDTTATSFVADEQRNHTSEYLQFDLGVGQEATFFAAITDAAEVFPLSSSATIKLYANNVDSWAAPALDVTLSRTKGGIFSWLDDLADTTYRYWRFEFIDRLNTVGPEGFHIGHVYIGDYTTLTNRNVGIGFTKYKADPSRPTESEGGQRYWRRRTKYLVFESLTISYLEPSDRANLEAIFDTVGLDTPFYVSFDPMLRISDAVNDLTGYFYFQSDPRFDHVIYDTFSMKFALKESL